MDARTVNDKVLVRIACTGTWQYCQDVEMRRDEFDALDTALDSNDGKVVRRAEDSILGLWISMRDMEIDDRIEIDDFRIAETQP